MWVKNYVTLAQLSCFTNNEMFNEAENYNNKTEHMKKIHVLAANNKRKQNIKQANKYSIYDKKSESDAQKRNISLKENEKISIVQYPHSTRARNDKRVEQCIQH